MSKGVERCEGQLSGHEIDDETARRAVQRFRRGLEGGCEREEAHKISQIGIELYQLRSENRQPLHEVAAKMGVEPSFLHFLEVGWVSTDEFMEHIDRWATTLGQDADQYKENLRQVGNVKREEKSNGTE